MINNVTLNSLLYHVGDKLGININRSSSGFVGVPFSTVHLSFTTVIGEYNTWHDEGVETLELKPNQTYVHYFKNKHGNEFVEGGRWSISLDEDGTYRVSLADWIDRTSAVRPGLRGVVVNSNIIFTSGIVSLKKAYLLRRSVDLTGFDFFRPVENEK